ncbi:uncharacterized protein PHACADRAFT_159776 [Phanerochaete carnosa HHB-10118-sp]|uniref:L domain-like protein n=1 Tax=Phanerochaete carnosa (strain HHB-10118-sp) TaxID=650164 RepID=K5X737_PHACS|nr:uncharacterized protein PHACADRAFT_159776 [Phanerochaete carnosa HHB-10118-sp]EKM58687.1 hypothetical protein PHACADRAFT_159776 [Phanerochaete carnosa HHB-10118-sp]
MLSKLTLLPRSMFLQAAQQKTPSISPSRLRASSTPRTKPPPSPTPGSRTLRPQSSLQASRPITPSKSPLKKVKPLPEEPPASPQLNIREQIALKRAEAKKAQAKSAPPTNGFDDFEGLEDATSTRDPSPDENAIDLGRWSVKETIERARTTGAVNLASRGLPCLPSALFEIHLGIKPEPLKLVPVEPSITTGTSDDPSASKRRNGAQDLEILKAWSNEILEVQPEISMFGSLKSVDLHNNRLTFLPDSFADLTALTSLDLSHNSLTSLPANIFALPSLAALNLSHNSLTSLPFFAPFSDSVNPLGRTKDPRGDWYCDTITRATTVLPRLSVLDISHNKLSAASIDYELNHLPACLAKLDLSSNPLGQSTSLIRALSKLEKLGELKCEHADIGDDSFPTTLFSSESTPFSSLSVLDLGETYVTRPAIEAAFLLTIVKQKIEYDVTSDAPKPGVLRVIVGKRVIKEVWEIEAERRTKARGRHNSKSNDTKDGWAGPLGGSSPAKKEVAKETWEIEAGQSLLTEGAKRRARAAAAAAAPESGLVDSALLSPPKPSLPALKPVEKEAWEIEAELGLLTAGGRRRARAAAVAAAAHQQQPTPAASPSPEPQSSAASPIPSASSALSSTQYYTAATQTLTLPPSAALRKNEHFRSFSLAIKPTPAGSASELALAVPTPTLPLAAIITQPFAHTLKVLVLTSRKMDSSFSLPADSDGPFLPALEELVLEGCGLGGTVPVSRVAAADAASGTAPRTSEALLPLLMLLFPGLRTLDLSYNALDGDALSRDALAALVLADAAAGRAGLRCLRLRGNALAALDGFERLAEMFRGNRDVREWTLEELDIRDNEIGRLPPPVGLLPLEVFLVDGNT